MRSAPKTGTMDIKALRKLVNCGEGISLEFKRKARHPEKIARELIAFTNTDGGTLLVGVDDDGTIYGSKFPREDEYAISQFLHKHCVPKLPYRIDFVNVGGNRAVVVITVKKSRRIPHFLRMEGQKQTFVRVDDMSILASREMVAVLKHQRARKGVSIRFGEREKKLLNFLDDGRRVSLEQVHAFLRISRQQASRLLVLLVQAGLINIHPSERGDFFSLAEESFLL
ncbi:MAG: ATP-binding protein [Bacteroidota bacterium]